MRLEIDPLDKEQLLVSIVLKVLFDLIMELQKKKFKY